MEGLIAAMRKLTNTNHIRAILRDFCNFTVELVEDLIIFFTMISRVEWCDVSLLLLLEPVISVSNVAHYVRRQLL